MAFFHRAPRERKKDKCVPAPPFICSESRYFCQEFPQRQIEFPQWQNLPLWELLEDTPSHSAMHFLSLFHPIATGTCSGFGWSLVCFFSGCFSEM